MSGYSDRSERENTFNVLVAVTDDGLAHEIVRRIREDLATVPHEIETERSARKLLTAFRQKEHEVVILSTSLTGAESDSLVAEVRRVSGSTIMLLLGPAPSGDRAQDIGVEWIALPIVNWSRFLERVRRGIPEALRSRLGMKRHEGELYQSLVDYGRIFLEPGGYIAEEAVKVSFIPRHFSMAEDAPASGAEPLAPKGAARKASPAEAVVLELSWAQQLRVIKIEGVMLGALVLLTVAAFLLVSVESSERWFAIRNVLAAITGLSFAGFFAGRALDRHLVSKARTSDPAS